MTNTVEIVLTATDKASKTLTGFAKSFEGVGNQMTAIGIKSAKIALAGVVALGTGLAVMGAKAVSAGADAEEMLSKLDVTFGDTTKSLTANLTEFANATGRSKFELLGMSADLGAVMKGMGLTEEATAELANSFTQLAVDVGSFNNLPSVEVADKFRSALSGEYESLKSLGIVINQAMVEQELLNLGIEGGAKAATQAELVMARYNLIMGATTDAQGDAARTGGSFTNQMVALKAKLTDLKTEIGLRLLPLLTPLLNKFNDMAVDALPKLTKAFDNKVMPVLKNFSDAMVALMDGDFEGALKLVFGAEISGSIMNVTKWFKDLINNTIVPFVEEYGPSLVLAFKLIAIAIGGLLIIKGVSALIAALTSPIGLVTLAIGLLAVAWEKDWLGIRTTLTDWWEKDGKKKFEEIKKWLEENIPKALKYLRDQWAKYWPIIQEQLSEAWEVIEPKLKELGIALGETSVQASKDFVESTGKIKVAIEELNPILEALEELSAVVLQRASVAATAIVQFVAVKMLELLDNLSNTAEQVLVLVILKFGEMFPTLDEFRKKIDLIAGSLRNITNLLLGLPMQDPSLPWGDINPPKPKGDEGDPLLDSEKDTIEDPIDEDFDIGIHGGTTPQSPFGMLAPAGASGVTINATINNGIDIERVAFRVAEVISSRQR